MLSQIGLDPESSTPVASRPFPDESGHVVIWSLFDSPVIASALSHNCKSVDGGPAGALGLADELGDVLCEGETLGLTDGLIDGDTDELTLVLGDGLGENDCPNHLSFR